MVIYQGVQENEKRCVNGMYYIQYTYIRILLNKYITQTNNENNSNLNN